MIASRELSARPGAVWTDLAEEGAVVVTRDGVPMGIISPTSAETLLEDMQEIAFAKARHAVKAMREAAATGGANALSRDEIDVEIRNARKARKR